MFGVTTTCAAEDGLRRAGSCVDVPARAARLAGVGGDLLFKAASAPGELVREHPPELPPPCVEDASRQPTAGLHHVADLEFLDDYYAVALGVLGAECVQEMLALPSDLAVQDGDASLGLLKETAR
jgi:hypothetical protein